ncbi:MAG: L-aspartate oxidase, partial [Bacillota bacterium]
IIRNQRDMQIALESITEYYNIMKEAKLITNQDFETMNMAIVALRILKAALKRKKSVGAHYREDKQEGDNK